MRVSAAQHLQAGGRPKSTADKALHNCLKARDACLKLVSMISSLLFASPPLLPATSRNSWLPPAQKIQAHF